jgi:hypothetical protein
MSDFAQDGFGTTLSYKIGSGSYTALANLIDLEAPEIKAKVAKYQPMNGSPFAVQGAQCGEVGDAKFTCLHGTDLVSTLNGLLFNNTLTWKITLADGSTTEVFLGVLNSIGRKYKAGEWDVIDIGIAVNGGVTFGGSD